MTQDTEIASLPDHPFWPKVCPYIVMEEVPYDLTKRDGRPRKRFEIHGMPQAEVLESFTVSVRCCNFARCGNMINPIRSRLAGSARSTHSGLYIAAACLQSDNNACSRTRAASKTYWDIEDALLAYRGLPAIVSSGGDHEMEDTAIYRAAVAREGGAWDFLQAVRTEHRIVMPDQARNWLENCRLDIQREADESYVESFASALKRGEMRVDSICFAHYKSKMFLVNGQHRLLASSISGEPLETVIIHFDARDMDHVRWMYLGLDGGKSRKLRDRIISSGVQNILHLPISRLGAAAGALKYVATGFKLREPGKKKHETYIRSMDLPLIAIREWEDEIVAYFGAFPARRDTTTRGLERQGVIAAFLVLLRPKIGRPEEALSFIQRVANNDGLRRGEPAWALAETLRVPQTKGDHGAVEMARRVAIAWNAYLGGRTLENLNLTTMPIKSPIRFDGTRYDGRQVYEESFEMEDDE